MSICLIVYAIFQFYQVFSSVKYVFFDSQSSDDIKILSGCQAVAFTTSSILLIVGVIKPCSNCLIGALLVLLYKIAFTLWFIKSAYYVTIGCDDRKSECDPERLKTFYVFFFINRELNRASFL